jgi:hypothetical protein
MQIYEIRYSKSNIDVRRLEQCLAYVGAPLPQPLPAGSVQTYSSGLPMATHYFALKVGDEVPNWSGISFHISHHAL